MWRNRANSRFRPSPLGYTLRRIAVAPSVPATRFFRQPRVGIIGCGDVGLRCAAAMRGRVRMVALTSSPQRVSELRAAGVLPIVGNLDCDTQDDDATARNRYSGLHRIAKLAAHWLYLAPPRSVQGILDCSRTGHLIKAWRHIRQRSIHIAYVSTTGVYGNRNGDWVHEHTVPAPSTTRAHRRVSAEQQLRRASAQSSWVTTLLRAPGIYAPDRAGSMPLERLRKGLPVLVAEDDVYTNRIHADDLAQACVRAVWRGKPQRVFNVCDDAQMKLGDFLDTVARHHDLPKPERVTRAEMAQRVSPMRMSFLNESRRIGNTRLKELRVQLRYPKPLFA